MVHPRARLCESRRVAPRSEELAQHRVAVRGHCYRMLGSVVDADDAVQETMLRALRGLAGFDGRAALRTWLIRIATNVCLDMSSERKRRLRPVDAGPAGSVGDELRAMARGHWLDPIADLAAIPDDSTPAERTMLRDSLRLAFVAALQQLPPKQRAALLMTEIFGFSAEETADVLAVSTAAVNSALQRARASMEEREPAPPERLTLGQAALAERYLDAFERFDIAELTSLVRADAAFSTPPHALWLCGPSAIREWLHGPGCGCRGSRLIPTEANGSPAFGQYRPCPEGGHRAWALIVLEVAGDRIASWSSFLDTELLFPRFGLPAYLPPAG